MYFQPPQQGLALANELVAGGHSMFTFGEAEMRLGKSKTATANLLKRMEKDGLVDRVRRGHYVVRQLGVLGTPAAAESVALSVGAALSGVSHRIAYRSALYEHDLLVHPSRSIQVATERRIRTRSLSGWPLQVVIESPEKIGVGRVPWEASHISDRHRAVLDAACRPRLVGGVEVLADSFAAAAHELDAEILMDYARRLGWSAALRRLVRSPAPWHWNHSRVSSSPSGPSLRISISNPEPVNPWFGGIAGGACAGKDPLMNYWP